MSQLFAVHRIRGLNWWWWVPVIHLLLLTMIYLYVEFSEFHRAPWLRHLNLIRENNIAVWWSGFCLMTAGLLFYRMGSLDSNGIGDRVMWLFLAAVVLALSVDETGSLHERVSALGGWWALLPFALVGGAAFLFAVGRCLLLPNYRLSGVLILVSLAMFVAVAGMEHLGDIDLFRDSFVIQNRHVIEEGMELLSETLLLLSGVLALGHATSSRLREVSIIVDPFVLYRVREFVFVCFVLHLCITVFWMPYLWDPSRGNPAYWFPMLAYTLSAFYCVHHHFRSGKVRWLVGFVLLMLLSVGQMQNWGIFFGDVLGFQSTWIVRDFLPRVLWTTLPVLVWLLWVSPIKRWMVHTALLLGGFLVMRTGGDLFETYYIYSGLFGLLVFNLLRETRDSREE